MKFELELDVKLNSKQFDALAETVKKIVEKAVKAEVKRQLAEKGKQ